jgi:hypothetical protein
LCLRAAAATCQKSECHEKQASTSCELDREHHFAFNLAIYRKGQALAL